MENINSQIQEAQLTPAKMNIQNLLLGTSVSNC